MTLSFTLGAGASYTLIHRGGYHPGPLPPVVQVSGGPIPASHSLIPFIVRVHNQGFSNSCVGQTVATIKEITVKEHRIALHRRVVDRWFSAGYVYDQINRGLDGGATYQDAFSVLQFQGDALYRAFPHDGIDYLVQPDFNANKNASHYKIQSFRSIGPSDRTTISYEIAHGRPVAVAIPVDDIFYNQAATTNLPTVSTFDGAWKFWHSMTAVAYDPTGLTLLNSWGPNYGFHGLVRITWRYLATIAWDGDGAAVVVSTPKFAPTPAPTPAVTATAAPQRAAQTPTALG
jgi:hypothetical protein